MLKPQKIIEQDGDSFNIKTLTTFRNYSCSFKIGEEFEEVTKGLDNRKCKVETYMNIHYSMAMEWGLKKSKKMEKLRNTNLLFQQTTVNWDNDKLVCVQKGEKKNRGWTHWIDGDNLYLVSQTSA